MLSDSMGWMNAGVTARWRTEERRMRYLLETMYLGRLTRAGVMSKVERRMRTGVTACGEGVKLRALPERTYQEGFEFRTLVGRRGKESMKKLNSVQRLKFEYLTTLGRRKLLRRRYRRYSAS